MHLGYDKLCDGYFMCFTANDLMQCNKCRPRCPNKCSWQQCVGLPLRSFSGPEDGGEYHIQFLEALGLRPKYSSHNLLFTEFDVVVTSSASRSHFTAAVFRCFPAFKTDRDRETEGRRETDCRKERFCKRHTKYHV